MCDKVWNGDKIIKSNLSYCFYFQYSVLEQTIDPENGGEIFSIHGQFYKKNWRDNQLANRARCAKYYLGCNEKSNGIAEEAMNAMFGYWKKMCYEGRLKIKKMNYVNPGQPEE